MANPLSLVRAPRSAPTRCGATALTRGGRAHPPGELSPPDREVGASAQGQRARRRYTLPAPGTPKTRQRDALIVSILAYAGLRPGELRALPLEGFRENIILVQRAANPDGSSEATKNRQHRTVRLLSALAQDVREYKFAIGRPPEKTIILLDDDLKPWERTRGRCGAPTAGHRPAAPWDSIRCRAHTT
jgi:integrase